MLTINFWPRATTSSPTSITNYDLLAINSLDVVVTPSIGGAATRIILPSPIISNQTATITRQGSFCEIKLATVDKFSSLDRSDVDIVSPLSTKELCHALPASFACSKCDLEIIDSLSITKYNALPSEHWAELLDSWMCHGDQELSQDLVEKGRGIKPRLDEGLVGSSYIVFGNEVSKNWITLKGVEVSLFPRSSIPSAFHLFPGSLSCHTGSTKKVFLHFRSKNRCCVLLALVA